MYKGMCLDYFGKHCMPVNILVIIFYINTVSTSTGNLNPYQNTTNLLRNKETTQKHTNISNPSSSYNFVGISKQQENGFDLSEIIVHLDAALLERRLNHSLDKEDKEFLRWLDIDPESSHSLARLKRFKRQASNPRPLKRKASKSSGVQENKFVEHLNFKKSVPSHSIYHKIYQAKKSARVPSQTRLEKIIPELRWIYDSSSLDPSLKRPKRAGANRSSLKRSKRQVDPAEFKELPRWPGMPTEMPAAGALRQVQKTSFVKRKIMNMMMQSLYSAQERLWPLGPIVAKYDQLTPYRMAFIFLKLDQLVHESHSIMMYLDRQSGNAAMTITKRLQMYSQLMRRNVDVTYLVDYIMERVPKDQVVRIRQQLIRHEQEKLMKSHVVYAKTTTQLLGRPT